MQGATEDGRLVCGRYRLQERIGRGAMTIVWRARDELLDREVAVKEVRAAGLAAAERVYQDTLREARAASRLNHPGVVTVFDVVEEDGSPWIVMGLVPGRSLDRLVAEDGPLPPLRAARVAADLLSALACVHAAGMLHRDVKPGNVLIGPDDRTVLTDFGIAAVPSDPALTPAGMVLGTPGFIAPERMRGGAASPASDLWSLGATLFTAVEGRGPFERPGGAEAITAAVVGEDAPTAPSAGPLGTVIDALLRASPDRRPDAAAAARLLADAAAEAESGSWCLGELPLAGGPGAAGRVAAGPAGAAADGLTRGRRRRMSRRARLNVLTAAAIAAVAGAVVLVFWAAYPRSVTASPPAHAAPASQPESHPGSARSATTAPPTSPAPTGQPPAEPGTTPPATAAPAARGSATTAAHTGISTCTGGVAAPPAGYRRIWVTAAGTRAAAGFEVAAPRTWLVTRQGLATYLRQPAGRAYIEVSLARFTYRSALREVRFLQAQALEKARYPGYRLIAIGALTFRCAHAAALRFGWDQRGVGRVDVLELLLPGNTLAGAQPYVLSVSAPSAGFPVALAIFRQALQTFRPLV